MIKDTDILLKHLMYVPKIDEVRTTFNEEDVPARSFGMNQVYRASATFWCEVTAPNEEHAIRDAARLLNRLLYTDAITRIMDIQRENHKPYNQGVVNQMLQDLINDMMGS